MTLDAGLSARLAELARACAVPAETVALTGLALLRRRYTGDTHAFGLGLSSDASIADTLARACALPAAHLLTEEGECWQVRLDCDAELAEPMALDLVSMLTAMADGPQQSTVDLLPVAHYERRRELPAFEPAHPNVASAFAATVARHPDRVAVLTDEVALTYRELGSAVAGTARDLGGAGPVALLCQHGPHAIVGLLAALAAGRAYVPLDPAFPRQRLAAILADSGADAVLVDAAHEDLARELAPQARIVHIGHAGEPFECEELCGPAQLDDPAYLLYTSGSTGKPKGVVQSHRNVLFSIANHVRSFRITPEDRTSVLTSFGYDMAVTDTFGALLSGAAAVPVDIRSEGLGQLAQRLTRHRVSIYHSTPTVFRYLMAIQQALPDMRVVLLGGEEVTRHDAELARAWCAADVLFVNGYGATEISFITQYHVPRDVALDRAVMPVGHPLDGVDVVLVDAARRPVCLTGEVLVRSEHVALGYWEQPDLTSQRFVGYQERRAYLTGDLARRLPDGRLVFLARADRMVKIRGHRVELGEVEAHLAAAQGVAHAAVVAHPSATGETEIIGYAVPAPDSALDPAAIRGELAASLPDFMLPRVIVTVPALPMGPTGKLDVAALPAPPAAQITAAPGTGLERVIGDLWCDVLGLSAIDRQASVVQLGAHSLQMALVQKRLEETLGRRLPLARLFEFPTVAALADHLTSDTSSADEAARRAAERMRQRRKARS
ncbi:peptide synthetase [Rhizocola hellebori]|uniref:Peptide synthetase n=1 Tax=Rhizocola hellebori TaxID=1392758 RepID=A0A8J3QGK7_9ACTN|nr:peptide synthetase [Rhizocola hellebori]